MDNDKDNDNNNNFISVSRDENVKEEQGNFDGG